MEITQDGRGGNIVYRQTGSELSTWWEFAAGDRVVVFIAVPTPGEWDRQVPWAVGRRAEILARVGSEAIRQKASACSYEIGDRFIDILWPSVTNTL